MYRFRSTLACKMVLRRPLASLLALQIKSVSSHRDLLSPCHRTAMLMHASTGLLGSIQSSKQLAHYSSNCIHARWAAMQCKIALPFFSSPVTIIYYYIQSSTQLTSMMCQYIRIFTASGLTLISTTCSICISSVFLFGLSSNPDSCAMDRCKLGMGYQLWQTLCDSGGKHFFWCEESNS